MLALFRTYLLTLLALMFSLPSFASVSCDRALTEPVTETELNNILVITAMELEKDAVLNALGNHHQEVISEKQNLLVDVHQKGDKTVYIAEVGVGLVNAGISISFIAEKKDIDAILVLGIAGSLDPHLQLGDLVLAERVAQHDAIYTQDNGIEQMAPGALHLSVEKEARENPFLETDPSLNHWILKKNHDSKLVIGDIVSGSEFVGSVQRKSELQKRFPNARMVDMESVAIMMVGKRLGIPVAIAKSIADRFQPDGTIESDYKEFSEAASKNASQLILRLME